MSTDAAVAWDIELLLANGSTWQGLTLIEQTDDRGNIKHKTLDQRLTALLADLPLGEQLHTKTWENRGLGIGLDYNQAVGVYTRTPGIVLSAGTVTQSGVTNVAIGRIVAIEEFGADLFVAVEGAAAVAGGRVSRNAGGTKGGAFGAVTFNHADYAAHTAFLTAGEYIRDLCLFDDGAGTRYLYASSSDVNGLNGRLHRTSNGTTWTSTNAATFGTNGRNRLWRVFWRTRDGLSGYRLFTISGQNKVSYTIPNADPFLAASWVEGVQIDTAFTLLELAGNRRHVWMSAQDNVFDLDETGDSPGLMSYSRQQPQTGNGAALQYLANYLYVAMGRGIHQVYVGDQIPTLQQTVVQCAPGYGTKAENDVRGYPTAMCPDGDELVASIYNPTTTKSYVCWGKPKTQWHGDISASGPNPLLWYGPELFYAQDYKVDKLRVSGLDASAGALLWTAAHSSAGGGLLLHALSIPISGAPLQDLVSGGAMRFTTNSGSGSVQPNSYLDLLKEDGDEQPTTKILERYAVASRGLNQSGNGTKLTIATVADPAPGAITYGTPDDIGTSPSQTITPASDTSGSALYRRVTFVNPHGADAAVADVKVGVLEQLRMDYWRVAPANPRIYLTVQYGDGILNLDNVESDRDPDYITTQLTTLTSSKRTTLKTREGNRYTVKIEQVLETQTEYETGGRYGKTVTARLQALVLAAL